MNDLRQLTLIPERVELDGAGPSELQRGVCPVCGASLTGHRSNAIYCGGPCRAEASRVRRLRQGRPVDGYRDLAAYSARHKRTERDEPSADDPHVPSP